MFLIRDELQVKHHRRLAFLSAPFKVFFISPDWETLFNNWILFFIFKCSKILLYCHPNLKDLHLYSLLHRCSFGSSHNLSSPTNIGEERWCNEPKEFLWRRLIFGRLLKADCRVKTFMKSGLKNLIISSMQKGFWSWLLLYFSLDTGKEPKIFRCCCNFD